jgi:hypothetical protein
MQEMKSQAFAKAIEKLIDGWCERRNLRALRLVLPAYPMADGQADDWAGLLSALKQVRTTCREDLEMKEMDAIVSLIRQIEEN